LVALKRASSVLPFAKVVIAPPIAIWPELAARNAMPTALRSTSTVAPTPAGTTKAPYVVPCPRSSNVATPPACPDRAPLRHASPALPLRFPRRALRPRARAFEIVRLRRTLRDRVGGRLPHRRLPRRPQGRRFRLSQHPAHRRHQPSERGRPGARGHGGLRASHPQRLRSVLAQPQGADAEGAAPGVCLHRGTGHDTDRHSGTTLGTTGGFRGRHRPRRALAVSVLIEVFPVR